MSVKYPDQRVGIFIDVQNLYYSARALYGNKVNFGEIVRTATAGRKLVRAVAYAVKAEMPEEQSFFDALEKVGIEVKTKELQTFVGGQKKADWDVGIAVDVLTMAPKLDAVVLCSGDGDFQILLHHAKSEGCRAEVISFGKSTSAKLIDESDDFIDLDVEPNKYLLSYKNNNVGTTQVAKKPAELGDTVIKKPVEQINSANKMPQTKSESPKDLEDAVINTVNSEKPKKRRFFK